MFDKTEKYVKIFSALESLLFFNNLLGPEELIL